MTYVNKNMALNQLEELVKSSFQRTVDYLPDSFNSQQLEALEVFKKRIFLDNLMEETIEFNKSLSWENDNDILNLVRSAEELVKVFKLRSDIYTQLGYQKEFPDLIEGLNFDEYDKSAAILYCKTNKEITGTTRLIFDSERKLPSEKKVPFDFMREKYEVIGEISRLIIKKQTEGLSLDFKNLMKGIYKIFNNNNIDITISTIKEDHYKLYSKFGGIGREKELVGFGELQGADFLIISWDPSKPSRFFQKAFLK